MSLLRSHRRLRGSEALTDAARAMRDAATAHGRLSPYQVEGLADILAVREDAAALDGADGRGCRRALRLRV